MPPARAQKAADVEIKVDDPRSSYLPGDTITGIVNYTKKPGTKHVPRQANLTVAGRAKSKYVVKRNNGTDEHRGRAVLFRTHLRLENELLAEEKSWPFSVTIPNHTMPGVGARGDSFRAAGGFLCTVDPQTKQERDLTKHTLPTTMYYFATSGMSGKTNEAYVEYTLEATFGQSTVILPFFVRQRSTENPITNYSLRARAMYQSISTLRLLPEYAEGNIPFGKKMSSSFRSSKKPKYAFTIKASYPFRIQLEHPEPIPIKIYAVPNLEPAKTSICPDGDVSALPPITVETFECWLDGYVNVRAPGTMWDHENEKHHTFTFPLTGIRKPVVIPIIPDAKDDEKPVQNTTSPLPPFVNIDVDKAPVTVEIQEDKEKDNASNDNDSDEKTKPSPSEAAQPSAPSPWADALDMGSYFKLILNSSSCSVLGRRPTSFKRQLIPTFTTYNISTRYSLSVKMLISCAGETRIVQWTSGVTVLAPSEVQEKIKDAEMRDRYGPEAMVKRGEGAEMAWEGLGVGMNIAASIIGAVC